MKSADEHLKMAEFGAGERPNQRDVRRALALVAIEAAVAEERARCEAIARRHVEQVDWYGDYASGATATAEAIADAIASGE